MSPEFNYIMLPGIWLTFFCMCCVPHCVLPRYAKAYPDSCVSQMYTKHLAGREQLRVLRAGGDNVEGAIAQTPEQDHAAIEVASSPMHEKMQDSYDDEEVFDPNNHIPFDHQHFAHFPTNAGTLARDRLEVHADPCNAQASSWQNLQQ